MSSNILCLYLILFLVFSFPMIYADIIDTEAYTPTKSIHGFDDQNEIFILYDDGANYIILQNELGISEHYDAKVKKYNNNSFSMKNPESGIAVFAHYDTKHNSYRLVVLTSTGILKFDGVPSLFSGVAVQDDHVEQQKESQVTTTPLERTQPKSSVGADISKYNIPNVGRTDVKNQMLLSLKTEQLKQVMLGHNFEINGAVYNARNNERLNDATVTAEISRDNYILRTANAYSNVGGHIRLEFQALTYPEFYPKFCYDVKVVINYKNLTKIWNDDFVIQHSTNVWNPDMSWLALDRWNYLPDSFRHEPRVTINNDSHCN